MTLKEFIESRAEEGEKATLLKELKSLEEDSNWLSCLESAGVDNWSGYDHAREIEREWEEEDENG